MRGCRYTWSAHGSRLFRSLTFTPHLLNVEMTFGTGGYMVDLPIGDKAAAQALVEGMKVCWRGRVGLSVRAQ